MSGIAFVYPSSAIAPRPPCTMWLALDFVHDANKPDARIGFSFKFINRIQRVSERLLYQHFRTGAI